MSEARYPPEREAMEKTTPDTIGINVLFGFVVAILFDLLIGDLKERGWNLVSFLLLLASSCAAHFVLLRHGDFTGPKRTWSMLLLFGAILLLAGILLFLVPRPCPPWHAAGATLVWALLVLWAIDRVLMRMVRR